MRAKLVSPLSPYKSDIAPGAVMSLFSAEQRYARRRFITYQELEAKTSGQYPGIRAAAITRSVLDAWRAQWRPLQGANPERGGWDWESYRSQPRFQRPSRYELALWVDDVLCGLAIGIVTGSRAVHVHLLEGNPDPSHPLRGAVMELTAANAAALCLRMGGDTVRFLFPDPALIWRYEHYGFRHLRAGRGLPECCERVI
jgi:hypothetical protein